MLLRKKRDHQCLRCRESQFEVPSSLMWSKQHGSIRGICILLWCSSQKNRMSGCQEYFRWTPLPKEDHLQTIHRSPLTVPLLARLIAWIKLWTPSEFSERIKANSPPSCFKYMNQESLTYKSHQKLVSKSRPRPSIRNQWNNSSERILKRVRILLRKGGKRSSHCLGRSFNMRFWKDRLKS